MFKVNNKNTSEVFVIFSESVLSDAIFFDLMLFLVLNLEMKLLETSISQRTITFKTQ